MAMQIQIRNEFHEVLTFHGEVDNEYIFTVEMTTYYLSNDQDRTTFKFHWHKIMLEKDKVNKAEKRIEKMLKDEYHNGM